MNDISNIHNNCFACGKDNPDGLQLKFEYNQEDDAVYADFTIAEKYRGYSNRTHGGIIATILDCAMVHCLFARNIAAVTIDMHVKYRHPIETGEHTTAQAELISNAHGVYTLSAKIIQSGKIKATAKARFYQITPE